MGEGGGGVDHVAIFISFCHIFAHKQATVLAYLPKCSPFNLLSNVCFN